MGLPPWCCRPIRGEAMANLGLILLVFAFVCMCIATRYWTVGVWNMAAVGLAFWIAAELFGGIGHVLGAH